jgi:hypothetical protein
MKPLNWLVILLALCLFASFTLMACSDDDGDDDDDDDDDDDSGPCPEDSNGGVCFYMCGDNKAVCDELYYNSPNGCPEGCQELAEEDCADHGGVMEISFTEGCGCHSPEMAWYEGMTYEAAKRLSCWPNWFSEVAEMCDEFSACNAGGFLDPLWDAYGECEDYYEYCDFDFWGCFWECHREQWEMQDWNCGCFEGCFDQYC